MPVESSNSDRPLLPPWALRLMAFGALAVLVGVGTPPGAAAAAQVQSFLSFYVGVFALLSLTAAVVSGVVATERMILHIGHRVLAQAVHRAASLVGITCLISHIMVKVLAGQAEPIQIVVPFAEPIGLGTIAFELFLIVIITGLLRPRFATAARPWLWRTLHICAYAAWPIAITHGLTAGRSADRWVVLSYLLCVMAVALAAITRLFLAVKPRSVPRGAPDTVPTAVVTGRPVVSQQRQDALN